MKKVLRSSVKAMVSCAALLFGFVTLAAGLPTGFQEVEWIESTGKQYIDLGFKVDKNKTGLVMQFNSGAYADGSAYFGTAFNYNNYLFLQQRNMYKFYGSGGHLDIATISENCDMTITVEPNGTGTGSVTLDCPKGSSWKTATLTGTSVDASASVNLGVFGDNNGNRSIFRLYRLAITERTEEGEHVVARDFVPCYRVADNVAGLYDICSEDEASAFRVDINGTEAFLVGPAAVHGDKLVISGEPQEYGVVSPAYGKTDGYAAGSEYTLTAPADWTSEDGLTRAVCSSCTVRDPAGVVLATQTFSGEGETRSLSYTHPVCEDDVAAVWQWEVQNRVSVAAAEGGSVSTSGDWVAYGGTFTVTATPNEGQCLLRWVDGEGNVLGTSGTLSVKVEAPLEISAEFMSLETISYDSRISDYTPIINALVSNSAEGAVIQMGEGVFPLATPLAIDKAITLRGAANGGTVLKGAYVRSDGSTSQLTVSGGATLDHLAITGGNCSSSLWQAPGQGLKITSGTLSWCVITNNVYGGCGNSSGVGVYASVAGGATVKITHCSICDNTSATSYNATKGAGLFVEGGGSFVMDNTLVARNRSTGSAGNSEVGGGGIYINCSAQFINCTIADNHHSNRGGGVHINRGTPTFRNCIIARNTADNDVCVYGPDVSASYLTEGNYISTEITYACFNNLVSLGVTAFGTYGLAADPLFVTDGYQLRDGSPAIGVGGQIADYTDGVDLSGVARNPESVDLGCYKAISSSVFSVKVEVGAAKAFNDELVTVERTYYNAPEGKTLSDSYYAVQGAETNLLSCVDGKVMFTRPGEWSVLVVVRDGDSVLASELSATTVKVGARTLYVTANAAAVPEFPYATPETAATDLNEALRWVLDGSTVHMDEGTHPVSGTVSITKGVSVIGAGRDKTTIYATTEFDTAVVNINGQDALLRGVTVSHGRIVTDWTGVGAGVVIGANGGTMADCRVTDCTNNGWCRVLGAVKIMSSNALVTRCLIDGNTMDVRNADTGNMPMQNSCGGIYASAGRIENCVISNNVCMAYESAHASGIYLAGSATVLNCTVMNNRMTTGYEGSGVQVASESARVHNCIIDGNLSGDTASSESNYDGNGASFSYCLSSEAAPEGSTGCLVGRPVFKRQTPLSQTRQSPGRSQGSVVGFESLLMNATDFYGNPRVKHVSSKGVVDIDIGAVESKYVEGLYLSLR